MLEVDDTVVVDNLATHHGEAKRALRGFLNDIGIELLFLPVYSPDLNPVEVFSKLKYLLRVYNGFSQSYAFFLFSILNNISSVEKGNV